MFATVPIVISLGGPKGKRLTLDACAVHARTFAQGLLVGTTISGRTPKPHGPRPATKTAQMAQLILRRLTRETAPIKSSVLLSEKGIGSTPALAALTKAAFRALRAEELIVMHGVRRATEYQITAKGRARLKKKGAPTAQVSAPEPQRAARRLRGKRQRHRR